VTTPREEDLVSANRSLRTVDFHVSASSRAYHEDDDHWLAQVDDLYRALYEGVPGCRIETRPVAGKKGGIQALILAIGSAGALTAAVECFKAWLGRDKSRRIELSWTDGDRKRTAVLEGDAVDAATMQQFAAALVGRIGETPWHSDTAPS
jgi:hypothetical protein